MTIIKIGRGSIWTHLNLIGQGTDKKRDRTIKSAVPEQCKHKPCFITIYSMTVSDIPLQYHAELFGTNGGSANTSTE